MRPALLVIDVQNEYVTGKLPIKHPDIASGLDRIADAIDAANAAEIPIAVIRHNGAGNGEPFETGTTGWELHDVVASRPHDVVIDKHLPGSFTDTTLGDWLTSHDIDDLVLVGWMTHMCVDTTTREAAHRGLQVTVLADATGTIDIDERHPAQQVHETELAVLGSAFATVTATKDWVAGLGGD